MDLALESEAATALALRLARAFDVPDEPLNQAYRRILTPAAKFWICKRSIEATAECMEVWGGNGYIETGPMARLYREAPVNSIWEGSGNIMCLDVLRALRRHPELAAVLMDSLEEDAAGDTMLQARASSLRQLLATSGPALEAAARHIAQEIVLLVQAGLLRRHGTATLADAFIRSRYAGAGRVYGVTPAAFALSSVLDRCWSSAD